jgi:hypothetical protein
VVVAASEQRSAREKYQEVTATLKAVLATDRPNEAVLTSLLARMQSTMNATVEQDAAFSVEEALARRDEVKELLKQKGLTHLLPS